MKTALHFLIHKQLYIFQILLLLIQQILISHPLHGRYSFIGQKYEEDMNVMIPFVYRRKKCTIRFF